MSIEHHSRSKSHEFIPYNDILDNYEFERSMGRCENFIESSYGVGHYRRSFQRMSLDDCKDACAEARFITAREKIMNAASRVIEAQQKLNVNIIIAEDSEDSDEEYSVERNKKESIQKASKKKTTKKSSILTLLYSNLSFSKRRH